MATNEDLIICPSLASLSGRECVLGIDEAGRGPVLGPMVYAGAFCLTAMYKDNKVEHPSLSEAADSKTLSEEQREDIFEKINSADVRPWLAYILDVISPKYISKCMLGRQKVSLNEVSHNSAASLVRAGLNAGLILTHVYVDTVGPPESYEKKLRSLFPGVEITVAKKADALFQIVSVASICAKVTRDRRIKSWTPPPSVIVPPDGIGSGYPGDQVTRTFLAGCLDPIWGFPDSIVRHSWKTASEVIEKSAIQMSWSDDEDEGGQPASKRSKSLSSFYAPHDQPPRVLRHAFLADLGVGNVTE